MASPSNPVVLYDGVCGLCNRFVQFILHRDHTDQFRFASLQSPVAAEILQRNAIAPDLSTVYVVVDYQRPSEHVLGRSRAILFVLRELRQPWPLLGSLGYLVPRFLRDLIYDRIASNRYRAWGKYETCPLPDPRQRHKFLDT
jgi:predicted DCC family thiol-disulfide oxidoreductase YuxK